MMRHQAMRALAAVAAGLFVASPALAQINEADRLARCQNNRDALARLEAVRGNYATEEQISRARTALVSIRRSEAEINRNRIEMDRLNREIRWDEEGLSRGQPVPPAFQYRINRTSELTIANSRLDEQIKSVGASVNFHCPSGEPACVLTLSQRLATGIDAAVAQQPLYRQFLQQVATHNSNLVALRCDQSGGRTIASDSVGIPNVAGSWRGSNKIDYYLSQSGVSVNWSAPQLHESAAGSIANGVLTMRWTGDTGQGQASGSMISGSDGVAREIRWSNGVVFTR